MKKLLLLAIFIPLTSCSLPLGGGRTLETTYHPPGLSCGYPGGWLSNIEQTPTPAPETSMK